MKKIEITAYTAKEIESFLKSKEDYKIACRLLCILQLAKGGSSQKSRIIIDKP